jgi:hypothetical protein
MLTACLVVLGRHVRHLEFLDALLGNEPVLTPEEAFYERLLDDSDDATEQAEEFAKERSFVEFVDAIAIPALVRMQADRDHGAISADRCAKVRQSIKAMLEKLFDNTIEEAVPMPEYPARGYLLHGRSQWPRRGCGVTGGLSAASGGTHAQAPIAFCRCALSDVVYPRLFEQAELVFVSLISTKCACPGSLSRSAFGGARRA